MSYKDRAVNIVEPSCRGQTHLADIGAGERHGWREIREEFLRQPLDKWGVLVLCAGLRQVGGAAPFTRRWVLRAATAWQH